MTPWQIDFAQKSCGGAKISVARPNDQNVGRDSEKIHDTLDVFEYLLFRFIAFCHRCRQPPAAGRKQSFKGVADWRIGVKVSGDQSKSSTITIHSRLVIAANGIAHTLKQGL
ncbi:MAG: hypothetical protein WAR76_07460 [Xanthobacteraceae bacterium]